MLVACVLAPRLRLRAALEARRELIGRPVALAPPPGGPQVVGEPSGAAQAFGIEPGMRLGEALARCPRLLLVPPDPERAAEAWERVLCRLEGLGAAVETARAGEAFFELEGLRALWGDAAGVLRRVRAELGGEPVPSAARARRSPGTPRVAVRLGAGPTRLCAYAAALRARPRRAPTIVSPGGARAFCASLPVAILHERLAGEWERASLPETLERLGIVTLGELAKLPEAAVADRFGESGLRALRMARGEEAPLRPRPLHEQLAETLEPPEACSGSQLEQALELLVDRLLASSARRGRSLRRLRLGARLAGGGSWGCEVALRAASADRERLRLALAPKLAQLPGPAASLTVRAVELGPPAHEQAPLARSPSERRRGRLAEAVRQARAAAGSEAVLRVLEVEPGSRVPERRTTLTPFAEPEP